MKGVWSYVHDHMAPTVVVVAGSVGFENFEHSEASEYVDDTFGLVRVYSGLDVQFHENGGHCAKLHQTGCHCIHHPFSCRLVSVFI